MNAVAPGSCRRGFLVHSCGLCRYANKAAPASRPTRKQNAMQHNCRRCAARQQVNEAADINTRAAELQQVYSQEGWFQAKHKEPSLAHTKCKLSCYANIRPASTLHCTCLHELGYWSQRAVYETGEGDRQVAVGYGLTCIKQR
jgi:hypothetical protein